MEQAQEKIRVLIVDDIPETRENLRKLLYFESDMEVVGAATNGEEGIALSKELRPDVVLMDINLPGIDGISATEVICTEVPGTQVIMISVQGDADYLRRSMLAGAREFLIKPFTTDELVTGIRRVNALRAKQILAPPMPVESYPSGPPGAKRGKILAVYSPKGGRGCTTVAVNLAVALRKGGENKVVLVDADLQFGDVAVFLNLPLTRTMADLIPQLGELEAEMIGEVIVTHNSGVKVFLAPPRPEMAELVSSEGLRTLLLTLREDHDYVVVDTQSSLHELTLTVLDVADRILLLTTPEVPAIKDVRLFLEVIEALGYPAEKVILGTNKVLRNVAISTREIEESVHHKVEFQLSRDDAVATAALNQGVPVVIGQPGSLLARGIKVLASRLISLAQEPAGVAPDRTGKGATQGRALLSAMRK